MKTNQLILSVFTLAVAAGLITGCASSGNDKAAKTASSLTKSSDLIAKGNGLIDTALADLTDLVSNPQPDLRKQFKTFTASVEKLASTAKNVGNNAEGMKAQGATYFAKWDKEAATIQNEDIRNRSEARKNEVAAKFSRISSSYDEAKTAFAPFMADLRDVQKYLSTDLTAGGIGAIKDIAKKANKDAQPLKSALNKLSEDFKGLGLSMSPTTGATK